MEKTASEKASASTKETTSVKNTASAAKEKINENFEKFTKIPAVSFILSVFKNPVTGVKKGIVGYSDFNNSWLLPVIAAGTYTVFNLIFAIFRTVSRPASLFGTKKAGLDFSLLNKFDWFQNTIGNFLIVLATIAAIAGIYYLAGLIMKKNELNYFRLVTIVSVASFGWILTTTLISPLLLNVSAPIAGAIGYAGMIFSGLVVYEAMNQELELKGDKKILVNIIITAIIALAITLISASLIKSSTNSIVDSLNTLDSLWR